MLGKPVPDFSLHRTGGNTFRLSEQRGERLVLCCYPLHTSGCTTEVADCRAPLSRIQALRLPRGRHLVRLAPAPFSAMKHKNMHGKKVRGIERSTFVID